MNYITFLNSLKTVYFYYYKKNNDTTLSFLLATTRYPKNLIFSTNRANKFQHFIFYNIKQTNLFWVYLLYLIHLKKKIITFFFDYKNSIFYKKIIYQHNRYVHSLINLFSCDNLKKKLENYTLKKKKPRKKHKKSIFKKYALVINKKIKLNILKTKFKFLNYKYKISYILGYNRHQKKNSTIAIFINKNYLGYYYKTKRKFLKWDSLFLDGKKFFLNISIKKFILNIFLYYRIPYDIRLIMRKKKVIHNVRKKRVRRQAFPKLFKKERDLHYKILLQVLSALIKNKVKKISLQSYMEGEFRNIIEDNPNSQFILLFKSFINIMKQNQYYRWSNTKK